MCSRSATGSCEARSRWIATTPQTQEVEFEVDRNDRPSRKFGTFRTLPAGEQLGLQIGGFARITRGLDGTEVRALVFGLDGRRTYGAHLHNAPCSAADPGGMHYKHDPAGAAMPPNELWLSSTDDPLAGITSNAAVWPACLGAPTGLLGPRRSRS